MKHCLNCQGFAWWDGDFCCVTNMKLIQHSEDGKFTEPIENKAEDCEDYDYSPLCDDMYMTQYEEDIISKANENI